MKTIRWVIAAILFTGFAAGCSKEKSNEGNVYTLKMQFKPTANGEPLLFDKSYLNLLGEDYKVSAFKFYVSNVTLLQDAGIEVAREQNGFHLIDASNPATLTLNIPLNGNRFSHIGFQVGIDSIRNVSGAQTGALDPANGMFWTWNTGYIMAKLEGQSSFSNEVNQSLTYHIGGFKENEKTQRQVVLPIPGQQSWELNENSSTIITIDVNVDKWFSSVHALYIAANAAIMTPGPLSAKYADNYATMFNATSISRQ